jgi:hypothetical protein
MLNFIKSGFRGFIDVLFWIIPIGSAIAGGVTGGFWGVLIGIVAGILIDIVWGGFAAMLIAVEENTAKTEANTAEILRVLSKIASVMPNGGGGYNNRVADESDARGIDDIVDFSGGSDNNRAANERGRINYRSWWDSEGDMHESWEDADGTRHET